MSKNIISFVTLYDKGYLSRGLALYQSLKKQCSRKFDMHVLALDQYTYFYLSEYDDIKAITVEKIIEEYPVLDRLRRERSHQEFCWTLSSFFTQYVMHKYMSDICVYVDSDVFFFDDPCVLIDEMLCQNKSVLITEHKYYYKYDQTDTSGKFCVQFMPFLNDLRGKEVLEWWRKRCEEKCSRECDGKTFGDQKYLDDWESRFEEAVYNCQNIGAGIAPWNCVKYIVEECGNKKRISDKISGISGNLIFYHFHALRGLNNNCWDLSGYDIPDDFRNVIYAPYIKAIDEIEKYIDENILGSRLDYRLIDEYMFYPVPYTGEKHISIHYTENTEKQYKIIVVVDNTSEISIDFCIMPDGTLRIKGVKDVSLFLKNIHEVIWCLQTEFLFKTKDVCNINYRILKAIKDKQHIKLECFIESVEDIHVEHPVYEKKEMVELLSSNQYFNRKNIFELK